MAGIKLNSESQEQALASVIAMPSNRKNFFDNTINMLNNLSYDGGSRPALEECYKQFEKLSNDLVESEEQCVNLVKKNIEISEQMQKSAYLQNKVSNAAYDLTIKDKKHVDLGKLV